MESVYVIGHKNPDTDSVVSAIAYSALKNALGGDHYIAARYGHLNTETAFLLNRFGFQPPVYLRTVRTQVSDIDYDTPPMIGAGVPVSYAWQIIHTDDNKINLFFFCKCYQFIKFHSTDWRTLRNLCNAGITRCTI